MLEGQLAPGLSAVMEKLQLFVLWEVQNMCNAITKKLLFCINSKYVNIIFKQLFKVYNLGKKNSILLIWDDLIFSIF